MANIKLGNKVKGAILITVGDTDGDGKIGAKVRIYADIPLDGSSAPKQVVELPEWEPVDSSELPKALGDMMKWAGPIVGGFVGFLQKVKK
jgi:hypothetical protein